MRQVLRLVSEIHLQDVFPAIVVDSLHALMRCSGKHAQAYHCRVLYDRSCTPSHPEQHMSVICADRAKINYNRKKHVHHQHPLLEKKVDELQPCPVEALRMYDDPLTKPFFPPARAGSCLSHREVALVLDTRMIGRSSLASENPWSSLSHGETTENSKASKKKG
jgi:hypothetical protein